MIQIPFKYIQHVFIKKRLIGLRRDNLQQCDITYSLIYETSSNILLFPMYELVERYKIHLETLDHINRTYYFLILFIFLFDILKRIKFNTLQYDYY